MTISGGPRPQGMLGPRGGPGGFGQNAGLGFGLNGGQGLGQTSPSRGQLCILQT